MKRVFFFRPTLDEGGADRVTLTLLQHLDRRRFQPTLVLMRALGASLGELPSDVRVIELGSARLATSGAALGRVLHREKPDVLFSTASAANIPAVLAHRVTRSRGRLVLSERSALFRGRSRTHVKQRAEVALKRLTYRFADVVTAVSQGVADELAEVVGLGPERIAVVYNPMVSERLADLAAEPIEHPWFDGADPVVIAVGRLVEQKDYPTLIEAFARVRESVPARLVILGTGPLRDELARRVRARGLGGQVDFAGFHANPFKYMARARLLMQSSRVEGLPGSLIQAMACGTPVVSTDCNYGPREVIQTPGTDGFLVPVGDAAALADRAVALLRSPGLRDQVGQAARLSSERFSLAASMTRYQQAIGG